MTDEVTLRFRGRGQMKKVSDKFDALDTKLDDLESKRGQLRQVLVPWLLSLGFVSDPFARCALCTVVDDAETFFCANGRPWKQSRRLLSGA